MSIYIIPILILEYRMVPSSSVRDLMCLINEREMSVVESPPSYAPSSSMLYSAQTLDKFFRSIPSLHSRIRALPSKHAFASLYYVYYPLSSLYKLCQKACLLLALTLYSNISQHHHRNQLFFSLRYS